MRFVDKRYRFTRKISCESLTLLYMSRIIIAGNYYRRFSYIVIFLKQIETSPLSSNFLTIAILTHLNPATVSSGRENPSYICGLRARIECEP